MLRLMEWRVFRLIEEIDGFLFNIQGVWRYRFQSSMISWCLIKSKFYFLVSGVVLLLYLNTSENSLEILFNVSLFSIPQCFSVIHNKLSYIQFGCKIRTTLTFPCSGKDKFMEADFSLDQIVKWKEVIIECGMVGNTPNHLQMSTISGGLKGWNNKDIISIFRYEEI